MSEETKKKVDQKWKDQVNQEKTKATQDNQAYHEPTFGIFMSSLVMQAMVAMGKVENPLTNKKETNYDQTRFLIDTLSLLQEKTKNNLTTEEENILSEYLFNLRMMYVDAKKSTDG